MTPKLPGLLVRYIQQKRCVVFVGAGLSAGAGLPTWGRLLLKGIDELVASFPEGEGHQEELRNLVDRGKLLEVADFCKEKLGAAYHQFLTDQVRGDEAELPATHDALMHLPFSAWVTTNYDKLLERAYSKVKGGFPKTLTHKDTEALGRLLFDGGQFILKAHGDIDRPETVVLTSRDYSEIIHANPAFNEVFSGLLLTKALLFVGYSLSDPDFRLLMDRQLTHFKGFVPERYALMTGVGPVERDVLWRTARIQVIPYVNESGRHEEVLHFLEALKTTVLAAPASEAGRGKPGSPSPTAGSAQPGQVRPHMMSDVPKVAARSPGSPKHLEALTFAEPDPVYTPSPPAARPSPPAPQAPGPRPVSPSAYQLSIEFVAGRVQLRLLGGDAVPMAQGIAPAQLNEDMGQALTRAVEEGTKPQSWLYTHLVKLLDAHLPPEVLEALAKTGTPPQPPLVLSLAPELARFPWELLPLQGAPICLKRKLVRAPVGVPAQVRGAPQLRGSPRILLVEGVGGGGRELERLARLYEGAPGFSCKALMGADATFTRVMAELDEALPDLLHYSGEVGHLDGELSLRLRGDMEFSEGALRSILSQGRLPFLVMNAPFSAFAPHALEWSAVKGGSPRLAIPTSRAALFEGREGFMGLATQTGVGAFVGAFDRPGGQAGTHFMVALHRALLTGLPIAEAVLRARREAHQEFPEEPTALQYVLSGDGELQLWDSRRPDVLE